MLFCKERDRKVEVLKSQIVLHQKRIKRLISQSSTFLLSSHSREREKLHLQRIENKCSQKFKIRIFLVCKLASREVWPASAHYCPVYGVFYTASQADKNDEEKMPRKQKIKQRKETALAQVLLNSLCLGTTRHSSRPKLSFRCQKVKSPLMVAFLKQFFY